MLSKARTIQAHSVASFRPQPLTTLQHGTLALAVILACFSFRAEAGSVPLGVASGFGALASSTVTCTGTGTINGDIGVFPGSSVVGFPSPCTVSGAIHISDGVAGQGEADANTAFVTLAGLPVNEVLSGDLGGRTFAPGVYKFTSSGALTGTMVLDGGGQVNPLFVFQFGSTFISASGSAISLINGANADNVYFQVGSSATLGSATSAAGNIIAQASVTLDSGATLNGRAIGLTGAVTIAASTLTVPPIIASPPPPPPPPSIAGTRVLFVNPADNLNQQTFIRFVNPTLVPNEIQIVAYDDSGALAPDGNLSFVLAAQTALQLNAADLESGNPGKGLVGRLGDGLGKWHFEVSSSGEVVIQSLIRTPDGFLSNVSEAAPLNADGDHELIFANPGSNQLQQSFIRVVNTEDVSGTVLVSAIDDAGMPASGGAVSFVLNPHAALNFNNLDYTQGNPARLTGAFGTGVGKWHLTVHSDLQLGVMGLIRTPDGFVTNLSHVSQRASMDADSDRLPLTVNPASNVAQQSLIRLVNHEAAPHTLVLSGIDDSGTRAPDSVWVTLPAFGATQLSVSDLEHGNPALGVFSHFGGFGTGQGRWQVTVSPEPGRNSDAQSLVLVPGGFITNLSGMAPLPSRHQAEVWIFNPGSNSNQRSVLRLVNRDTLPGNVLIEAIDDNGQPAPGGSVTVALAALAAVELTAQDLEQGKPNSALQGALGAGTGKWRLSISADVAIQAQSLLDTPSGFLTDLSRRVE